MPRYKGILFAEDGDWVTDFERETKEEVIEALANRGSRWFFSPFEGVILAHNKFTIWPRVVDIAFPLEHLKGKSIRTVSDYIRMHSPLV